MLEGKPKLGVDIGGGGDLNVFTMRWGNYAKVISVTQTDDTMTNVSEIETIMARYPDLLAHNVFIDDTGIGRGVRDRCLEKKIQVSGVSVGEKPTKVGFSNVKAQVNFAMAKWLKEGNTIEDYKHNHRSVWEQLLWLKYKINSDKQIQMEPKEDLKKRSGKSPDFADSLALTFHSKPLSGFF